MRLYPVAPFLTRLIPKTSLQLGPYLVPPGSLVLVSSYTMARDSSIFYNPDLILPERWGRGLDATTRARQAFASLPFGHGPRGCIGRRLSEMQLSLLAANVCSHWDLTSGGDVGFTTRLVGVPDREVIVQVK